MESLARIAMSAALFLLLLRYTLTSGALKRIAHVALCALLACQCLLAADRQVNGNQAMNFDRPFHWGDFYQAKRAEFTPPNSEQLQALHVRLLPQHYRVALVCDQHIADGFCAGHVPQFWRLRAIDGYYGPGVPRRLRALPWPAGVSLRTISFTSVDTIPWDLLGLLNVRSVLIAGDGVFRNIVRDGDQIAGRPDPANFEIITSKVRVTPRAFFATAIEPASSPEDAAKKLFQPQGLVDPTQTSFVEGLPDSSRFAVTGAISMRGSDDQLELNFEAAATDRFLVVNELFYPGWRAYSEGKELPIYPTNAVMRGVLVPAGAKKLHFAYTSYLDSTSAWIFRLSALLLMLVLLHFLKRNYMRQATL